MHTLSTSFVLGYHGCGARVARKLLNGDNFRRSENDYDWLGHGIYFWESNPRRGLDFAKELKKRGKAIGTPALVGAVIDLGFCLDLTTLSGLDQVKTAYDSFSQITSEAGVPMIVSRRVV